MVVGAPLLRPAEDLAETSFVSELGLVSVISVTVREKLMVTDSGRKHVTACAFDSQCMLTMWLHH